MKFMCNIIRLLEPFDSDVYPESQLLQDICSTYFQLDFNKESHYGEFLREFHFTRYMLPCQQCSYPISTSVTIVLEY
jgi:hypothetical protein